MIELGRLPRGGVVTNLASLGESCLHVIGIGRPLVVLEMTGHAGRGSQVVIVVDVAVRTLARRNGMATRQGEVHRVVIEVCRLPGDRGVALLASLGKTSLRVVGISRPLIVLQVA